MKQYPAPADLNDKEIETRDLALRTGQAVAGQHPGVQIAEKVLPCQALQLDIQHPAHRWQLLVPLITKTGAKSATQVEKEAKAMAMGHYEGLWRDHLASVIAKTEYTDIDGHNLPASHALTTLVQLMLRVRSGKGKFIFIGNGGSAGIASHMAEDFTKTGGVRSVTFNDAALITCYANDYGWDKALARAVDHYGDPGDVLVAISSSGKSQNILNAVEAAKAKAMNVVTLSGFAPDNPLRAHGNVSIWAPAHQYGFVETAHAAILHMALDIFNGWVGQA
jgi:Phosphoheptose isomerase